MIEIVAGGGIDDRDWQIEGDPVAVTVGELAEALGLPPTDGPVLVDDRAVGRRTTLADAGVARGARLRLPSSVVRAPAPPADAGRLDHVAGLGAGGSVALPPGRHLLGRSLAGRSGVSAGIVGPSATAFEVDAGAHEHWIEVPGAVFRVDGTVPPPPRRRVPDERGLVPVHRPPRPPAPRRVAVPDAPPAPEPPRPPAPLSWVTVLGPLPVVAAMALLFSPRFALLGLAGPLLAAGRWAEGRVRLHREQRRHAHALAAWHTAHLAALRLAAQAERARRWRLAPGPDELRRAVEAESPLVWERRCPHDDALALVLGATAEAWPPDPHATSTRLGPVPYVVPLADRRAIGVVGAPHATTAVVRWLTAAAVVHHGPADLAVAALLDPIDRDGDDAWSWLKWLPHVRDRSGQRRLAATPDDAASVVGSLVEELSPAPAERVPSGARPTRFALLVVGRAELARDRSVREQLTRHGSAIRAIVTAACVDDLPAWCDVVVEIDGTGSGRVTDGGVVTDGVVVTGVDRRWVHEVARRVARLDDPEHHRSGGEVPAAVGLVDVLGLARDVDDLDRLADALARRWDSGTGLAVPVGADGSGAFVLDLVADGPHALVAGTTGAGKSELLRSWVAAMAASASPDDVNLILVDFKGGGAFDACADLPHTVAVVTDLDAHLAARALRCLRAEVRYRESLLRDAGTSDIDQYRSLDHVDPLPRLVVVVDEFATLAAELPDFLTSIVDIAQRGRSLGIHLVLATQRPSGVVDNKVRANTNLRVALRVQDDADSHDVVGCGDAARLSRRTPGRALARLGSGDVRTFQAALVSAASGGTVPATDALAVRPFTLWGDDPAMPNTGPSGTGGATDLERLAAAARLAARRRGCRPPRVPRPAPLPTSLDAVDVWAGDRPEPGAVAFGLADEPDLQRQSVRRWHTTDGNLLVLGANGADTTRVLTTLAVGLAGGHPVDDAHLYVVDGGSGGLAPVAALPHCGAYASGGDTARSARILEVLAAELDARRAATRQRGLDGERASNDDRPFVVLIVENAGAVLDALDADGERDALGHVAAIVRDGSSLGIHTILAVPHERALPGRLAGLVPQRLVLRMADTTSYLALGLSVRELPALAGLRAVATPDGTEIQVADVGDAHGAVQAIAAPCTTPAIRPPRGVRTLGRTVSLVDVDDPGRIDADGWTLPVAVTPSYRPVRLELPPGIHAMVVGAPGSGRSSTLLSLAHAAHAAAGGDLRLVVVTPRRSALARLGGAAVTAADAESLATACDEAGDRPLLVLVDDADLVGAPLGAALARLAETPHDQRRLVVAGRPDTLRSPTGWTAALRHGRTGIALQPAPGDGDVFRTALPLRLGVPPAPGRGYVITLGTAQLAQIALPPSMSAADAPG